MLTYAIGYVLDVQLASFAIILACMAFQDRANRSLRWLAFGYTAGFAGAVLDWGSRWLPHLLSQGLVMEAPLVGYGCFCLSIAVFVQHGFRARWLPGLLIVADLPFFLVWSLSGRLNASATLQDLSLAIITAITVVLLLITSDPETRWPRRILAAFFAFYSLIEFARVAVYCITGKMPDRAAPWLENASGIVYVLSCGALPLAFIWMTNSRLLVHLSRLSMIDPLTQLFNRRGLEAAVESELARYARSGRDFAVVVLDLDHFKAINDQFGHVGGDAALTGFSVFLRQMVREIDILGRFGGEEFVFFLPDTAPADAFTVVERIRITLAERPFPIGSRFARVTASFGIAVSAGRRELTWEILQREADAALYAAKRAGRNVSRFFQEARTVGHAADEPGKSSATSPVL